MTKLTKTLLILGLLGIVSGIAFSANILPVGESPVWFVCLPAGAIFFGLFMISMILQNAAEEFDLEQQQSLVLLKRQSDSNVPRTQSTSKGANEGGRVPASAH